MSLPAFLTELFEQGRVHVAHPSDLEQAELQQADHLLASQERHLRGEFPGPVPGFQAAAARWGAVMLYRACQLAMFRDLMVDKLLAPTQISEPTAQEKCLPDTHYSVDLAFSVLPDLARLTRGMAQQDPLLSKIAEWARAWPLSSVGIKDIQVEHVDVLASHPGMLRYYADRVIARRDRSRLDHPRVREAVRQAIGLHSALAPEIAAFCSTADSGTPQ